MSLLLVSSSLRARSLLSSFLQSSLLTFLRRNLQQNVIWFRDSGGDRFDTYRFRTCIPTEIDEPSDPDNHEILTRLSNRACHLSSTLSSLPGQYHTLIHWCSLGEKIRIFMYNTVQYIMCKKSDWLWCMSERPLVKSISELIWYNVSLSSHVQTYFT